MSLLRRWGEFGRRAPRSVALALLLALGGVIAAAAAQKADISSLAPQEVEISTRAFSFDGANPARRDFGRLEWRGGLILSASSQQFGGYSGLTLTEDGALLAISDAGSWLSARLIVKDGMLAGIADARIGPLPQKDGRPIQRRRDRDAESLATIRPGRYLIGFEGRHRIEEYVFEKGRFRGPVGSRTLPAPLRRMKLNAGLEGIALLRGGRNAGALVAFAEEKLDRNGNHTGALVQGDKSHPLFLKRASTFDITGLASLKDGSLLVLERSFLRSSFKLDVRLRLIEAEDIKPGALLQGEVLLQAGMDYTIDNFEGIAVTETKKGDTIITLMSDDNFNFFQRTLLAQFRLK